MTKADFDYQAVKKAWNDFVSEGVVNTEAVRPIIAKSWLRSRDIDPYNKNRASLSGSALLERQSENEQLISAARPIIQELFKTDTQNLVWLTDREGYIIDLLGNSEYMSLGFSCREADIGTNAIGTALVEGQSLELKGHEHYSSCGHHFHSIAAPIRDINNDIVGVIDLINPYKELPSETLKLVNFCAKTIELELIRHANVDALVDCMPYCVFLIDNNGNIINANRRCLDMLGINKREVLNGESLGKYVNKQTLNSFISKDPAEQLGDFNINYNGKVVNCIFRSRYPIDSVKKVNYIVMFTYNASEPDEMALNFHNLVGSSKSWSYVKTIGKKAAQVSSNILILGESGTGKELMAQSIHNESKRNGLFIPINCGAIPKELLQSELFGYEPGSFTGAKKDGSIGKFEKADGGTIFLDEIGEMPMDMQVSLLRFLQDKTVVRVGGTDAKKVDVRIIAATNRDLEDYVKRGIFREDLYYRINVINIKLPNLRDRKEDIPLLIDFFIKDLCQQFNRKPLSISETALKILSDYDWPGNVRELRNIVEYAVVFTEDNIINTDSLPPRLMELKQAETKGNLKNYELSIINKTLAENNGNMSKTARDLGIDRSTLYRKVKGQV